MQIYISTSPIKGMKLTRRSKLIWTELKLISDAIIEIIKKYSNYDKYNTIMNTIDSTIP